MTQDKDRTPVAQNIATLCTKCKMELNHTVIAHTMEGIVARVQCRTCGSEHKYHPEKKKAAPRAARPAGRTASARRIPVVPDFTELAEKLKGREPVSYSMSGSFRVDDVIDHASFGTGIVLKASHQRIEVLFSGGLKTLACGRG